jgi:calcium-translocating P-type ATPase
MGKFSFPGLTSDQVEKSRQKNGTNELPPPEIETFWEKLVENFQDPLIKILCVALVITLFLAFLGFADWFEGIGIAAAVFLATFVSTYSEYKNEGSFQQLQLEAAKIQNNVFREGSLQKVVVGDLVVGDMVFLEPGDKVPADGYLVAGSVQANQMALTGEAEPIRKDTATSDVSSNDQKDQSLTDPYRLFRGSVIEDGEGVMKVTSVGVETFYGKLAAEFTAVEDRKSPLQVKLSNLADAISTVGYIGASLIAVSFLFKQFVMDQGYSLERFVEYVSHWQLALKDVVNSLILAIIVIVVAVPEGLPMMIAIVLSLNMRKLLKSKVLVRKLLGIETAGSLSILFTDKTGTLTKGELRAHLFLTGSTKKYNSYREIPDSLKNVLGFCIRNSTSSQLGPGGEIIGGNASDRAFLSFVDKDDLMGPMDVHLEEEILFSSIRKFSAARLLVKRDSVGLLPPMDGYEGGDLNITVVKGAPEIILAKCDHYYTEDGKIRNFDQLKEIEHEIDTLSRKGLRVVAVATSKEPLSQVPTKSLPPTLALVGIVGIEDEVRPRAQEAVEMLSSAGIQVVMITGDRKETAVAVARDINLLPPVDENKSRQEQDSALPQYAVLTSSDIQKMNDEELGANLSKIRVIARALPTDKSRLVRVAQGLNKVVGMTGDGVNDSSALKKADVGFGMGSGTEVAKEASDIVILDDDIFSITNAVLYGRTIFKSIRKFVIFQSTINLAATLIVFLGPFMGFDFPLTIIQLLWVNLVMDTLAALAFGGEPALKSYMKEHPTKRNEAIISPEMWSYILFNGSFIAALSVIFLTWDPVVNFFTRDGKPSDPVFLTAFFSFFIFISVINAFNVRTPRLNVFNHLFKNSGFVRVITLIFVVQITFTYLGGSVLRTVPLTPNEWLTIIVASLAIIPWDSIRKIFIAPLLPKKFKDLSWLEEYEKQDKKDD